MERDFKGIWIPKEIWLSEKLTLQEKVFLVEISSLDNESGCYANNEYFSKFFGISKTRVSEVINSLIEKGVLFCHIDKANGNKRILTTIKGKLDTLLKKSLIPSSTFLEDPIKDSFKHNNTDNNKTNNTNKNISSLTLPFVSDNFLNTWNEFLKYRDVKGKKVSYDACKRIFKDLAKEDENIAIAMLEKTIKNDWQGVFPLNEAEKKQIKKSVAGFGLQSNIFEGLRFFYKNVPSEIYMDRDKCIAIPDSVFGYNKRVINYPEYTKFRNFLTQNGIDLDNLPAITFEPELFTKKEPIEILKLWIGKH